jgi:hypothetical protein
VETEQSELAKNGALKMHHKFCIGYWSMMGRLFVNPWALERAIARHMEIEGASSSTKRTDWSIN